tara:strand:- start:230 stop:475 length:246 start_codon:yes stop_codon:yes gene_type:complete
MTKSKHTKRNTKTGKYDKTGITDIDLYDCYKYLNNIENSVKNLKSDLKRDCIPYYKYDELVLTIQDYKLQIKKKDELKSLE